MEPGAFIDRVRERNQDPEHGLDERFVDRAVIEAFRLGDTESADDVEACLSWARVIRDEERNAQRSLEVAPKEEPTVKGSVEVPQDPATAVLADRLFDQLVDETRELRRELFDGNPDCPFSEWDEAVDWLSEEADRGEPPGDYEEICREYRKKIRDLCGEYTNRTGGMWTLGFPNGILKYISSSRSREPMVLAKTIKPWQARLWRLWQFVSEKAKRTGIDEESVLVFVLTGVRKWSRVLLTIATDAAPLQLQYTTIRFPSTAPSWNDFRVGYSELRKMRGGKKGLSEVNRALINAIRAVRGVPTKRKGKMAFWEKIALQVRDQTDLETFNGRAARRRFERFPFELQSVLKFPIEQPAESDGSQLAS